MKLLHILFVLVGLIFAGIAARNFENLIKDVRTSTESTLRTGEVDQAAEAAADRTWLKVCELDNLSRPAGTPKIDCVPRR